ncbi:MAG TPA: hypothetical protein VJ672_11270 [Gemmatimonadaceae bacterium]|nr:hypothetical protein [Gemmatimonadaceae bacterium]
MNIAVQIEPANDSPSPVDYRWDADTDILTASLRNGTQGDGMSGSVELTGEDGSWVVLDVKGGAIRGVEVAVWPDVRKMPTLSIPSAVENARITVPSRNADRGVSLVQVDTTLIADADNAERTIHFRLGASRASRTVRIASDILVDLDDKSRIMGLWLLNVPPFPAGE